MDKWVRIENILHEYAPTGKLRAIGKMNEAKGWLAYNREFRLCVFREGKHPVFGSRSLLVLLLYLTVAFGCQELRDAAEAGGAKSQSGASSASRPRAKPRPPKQPETLPEIADSGYLYEESPTALAERLGGVNEQVAVARVLAYVRDAVDLDPTLVVWLFDRSPSASKITLQAGRHINEFYAAVAQGRVPEVGSHERAKEPRLTTAVVSFGQDVKFPLEEPTADAQAVMQAIDAIPADQGSQEATFAAIGAALDKYLPLSTQQGRRLLLVVVTDEAGDDAGRVEDVLAAPRKYGVPVYAIGAAAPFGRVSALPNLGEGEGLSSALPAPGKGPALRHGPESLELEHVDLPTFAGFWPTQFLESGFGPFGLERLCRATGGEFIPLQLPGDGDQQGGSLGDWPSPLAVRFEREAMRRYTPDYLSPEAYQKLLQENGARQALHQAAAVAGDVGDFYPQTEFPKENEAQLQRVLSDAQQVAARLSPPVDRMYGFLQAGEADRAKLSDPRWQVGFDLALGRTAAAKARIDGYNAMLAMLKRGRNFEGAESTRWVLEPADATEAGTAVERLIQKARTNLEQVAREHPGTPWAHIAKQELEAKFGWRWAEH
jgi:hypothetical protein